LRFTARVGAGGRKSRRQNPKKGPVEGQRERNMWRDFSKAFRELLQVNGRSNGAYRPDLHYMRGPGPKWHAKYGGLQYGGLVTKSSPAASSSGPALHDIAEHRA
jgi:hypothetical protein